MPLWIFLICTDNIIFFLVLQSGHKKSLVHGFISDDGVFEGKIHVGDDEYFVESEIGRASCRERV